jgi:glycosyltransferase involved in cell wall biosynthesis
VTAEPPSLSVVVSTYDWPQALDLALRGLAGQKDVGVEVVVADDGSGSDTADVVERWQPAFDGRLAHVRQEDEGFRLARVRNLGALAATGRVLAFMDGDCIPRPGFARAVLAASRPGWYLGGKRVHLSEGLTRRVLAGEVEPWRWSLPSVLLRTAGRASGLAGLTRADRRRPGRDELPDFVPDKEGWGFFFALSGTDFERANGYDARYVGWGGEDVDLALRLGRLGLRGSWAGPASTLFHLWHADRTPGGPRPNAQLLAETRASDRTEAVSGLRELEAQESANSTTGSGSAPFASGRS